MTNEQLPITKGVLAWARQRAGMSVSEVVEKYPRYQAWEEGDAAPTYPQLERLSDDFKLPIAAFFFPEPPRLPPIRESFRTLPDIEFERLPRQVRFLLGKAKALQLNLAELARGQNLAARFILRELSVTPDLSADALAARVRGYLGVGLEAQLGWRDNETALKAWRSSVQDVGVFVFKDAFRSSGYCGFSIFDATFPLIYVNNTSAKTRQIFTIFHELAHLLLHTSGIDAAREPDMRRWDDEAKRVEVFCNRFAAQFLLPESAFADAMRDQEHTAATAERLAERFHISREVVFRRFLDRRWIDAKTYREAVDQWTAQLGEGGKGGDYYRTKLAYLGREYVGLALREYRQNRIDDVQLAEYLDTKPRNLATLEERYLAGA